MAQGRIAQLRALAFPPQLETAGREPGRLSQLLTLPSPHLACMAGEEAGQLSRPWALSQRARAVVVLAAVALRCISRAALSLHCQAPAAPA